MNQFSIRGIVVLGIIAVIITASAFLRQPEPTLQEVMLTPVVAPTAQTSLAATPVFPPVDTVDSSLELAPEALLHENPDGSFEFLPQDSGLELSNDLLLAPEDSVLAPDDSSETTSNDQTETIPGIPEIASQPAGLQRLGLELLYFSMVVLGIIAKQLLENWKYSKSKKLKLKIKSDFAIVALIFAAPTYAGIASQIPITTEVTLVGLCLVFQYGLACQAVVDILAAKLGTSTAAAPQQAAPQPVGGGSNG